MFEYVLNFVCSLFSVSVVIMPGLNLTNRNYTNHGRYTRYLVASISIVVYSLSKNYSAICSLMDNINVQFSSISLTEIWIKELNPFYNFNNYKLLLNERQGKKGGGVGILLHDNVKFQSRNDLNASDTHFESIFIEVEKPKKNDIYGVIYRPPDQPVKQFLETLEEMLNIVNKENKNIYLMGDLIST